LIACYAPAIVTVVSLLAWLWIAGEDEPGFELDQLLTMKRRIPGAELLIVNHAAHSPHRTHPHLVGPAIVDFLTRIDERCSQ
jgi:pimeloyl-ACP methyl ester carboxylesterase